MEHRFTSVIIPAAGSGSRMQANKNKQFLELSNKPIIVHTIQLFDQCSYIDEIIVVAKESEQVLFKKVFENLKLRKPLHFANGGKTRQESVHNGIKACSDKTQFVAVHDGARPFLKPSALKRIIQSAYGLKSIVTAVPSKDTVKRVNEKGIVVETLKRNELWNIQTPQIFEYNVILKAYEEALKQGFEGTDDGSLVEWIGEEVHVVMGDYQNIKVTTPEDLVVGEIILKDKEM